MFYIIEQGARIQTPIEKLLRPEIVPQVQASSAVAKIDQHQPVNTSNPSFHKAYQQASQQTQQHAQPAIFAHQIMTSPAICLKHNKTIDQAWAVFEKHRFHHLPIVNNSEQICGIVSDRDLLRYAVNHRHDNKLGNLQIKTIMRNAVITAAAETEIRAIAEIMAQRSFGALPIVDPQQQVQGIVSRSDILHTLVNQANLELWA